MKRFLALLFAFLLFLQLPSARVVWSYQAADGVTGKALLVSGNAIFASANGKVYALNAAGGTLVWSYDTGDKIVLEPQQADENTLAVVTGEGKLSLLSTETGGKEMERSFNRPPMSLATGGGNVFLAFENSVVALDFSGTAIWNASFPSPIGQMAYSEDSLYFTSGGSLYAVGAQSGETRWTALADNAFLSRPAKSEGAVYLGATDGRLYSFDANNGRLRWSYQTGGWIMSTPLATDSAVYFGSNDGYFYSLSLSGLLRYKIYIGDGVWSQPEPYKGEMVFSANNGKVYGLNAADGTEKWSFSAYGKPGPTLLYEQKFLFGTSAGKIYLLSPSPICSFTWPSPQDAVGNWPIDIEGSASADTGVSKVEVRAAGGEWIAAEGRENWKASVNFETMPTGGINVECRAYDRAGNSESNDYSFITLRKMDNVPAQKMYVSAPYDVDPKENFTISAKDERGISLTGISVKIDGQEHSGSSPMQLALGKIGVTQVTVEKPGFETAAFTINGKGGSEIFIIGAVILVVALALVYFFVIRKMLKKKK